METLKKIFTNKIAIAVLIGHWLVFIFSLFYERHLIFRDYITFHSPEPILYNFLLFLNTPAAWIMQFIIYPVLSLFEKNLLTEGLDILFFVILSSLQWLSLGYLIEAAVEIYKPKEVKSLLK